MNTPDFACLVGTGVALAYVATQIQKSQRLGRESHRAVSACTAMRSTGAANAEVTAKRASSVAAQDVDGDEKAELHGDIADLFTSIDKDANAKHLARPAQNVQRMQNAYRSIQPQTEISTYKNRQVGGFTPRLGVEGWEQSSDKLPKKCKNNDGIMLPMNNFEEHAWEQHCGEFPEYGKYDATNHPIDDKLISVM